MNLQCAVLAAALASAVSVSLGGTETNVRLEDADETAESEWESSISTSTYLVLHGRDYANPNLVADRGWLHLEARFNYEAIKTGSFWLGYNFSFGKKLAFEVVSTSKPFSIPSFMIAALPAGIELCRHPDVLLNTSTRGLPLLLLLHAE